MRVLSLYFGVCAGIQMEMEVEKHTEVESVKIGGFTFTLENLRILFPERLDEDLVFLLTNPDELRQTCFLAGYVGEEQRVPMNEEMLAHLTDTYAHEGSFFTHAELENASGDVHSKDYMRWNKSKICPNCAENNEVWLKTCKKCNGDLAGAAIKKTMNVFTTLLTGTQYKFFGKDLVAKLAFRYVDDDIFMDDDPLCLSYGHTNILPFNYIPTALHLLNNPEYGLHILQKMKAAAEMVLDRDFKFQGQKPDYIIGFNIPPSQYLLHAQVVPLPLTPEQMMRWEQGNHFHYKRFAPMEYIEAILKKMLEYPETAGNIGEISIETDVKDIHEHFEKYGVSYDQMWEEIINTQKKTAARELANIKFSTNHFKFLVANGKIHPILGEATVGPAITTDAELLVLTGIDVGAHRASLPSEERHLFNGVEWVLTKATYERFWDNGEDYKNGNKHKTHGGGGMLGRDKDLLKSWDNVQEGYYKNPLALEDIKDYSTKRV